MSQQPCRLTVGELRKIVTRARKDNHLTGPANKEQLVTLFERHADMDESVGEVLEGPIRVPMLKVQRTMLRDMYHPKVSEMNRTTLLRYIYMAAHTLGWDFPDMGDYTQRTRIGKACQKSRPIGQSAKPPAGILSKKDRPKRALSRHQKFISQKMRNANVRMQYPDAKERFKAVSAMWQEQKGQVAQHDRAVANRRRARQQVQDDADDVREERARTRRQAAAARKKEAAAMEKEQRDKTDANQRRLRSYGRVPKRKSARAASRR